MASLFILGQARPKFDSPSSKCFGAVIGAYFYVILSHEPLPRAGSRLKPTCVGNLMRLSLDQALAVGNQLEVEAISESASWQ